MNEVEAMAVRRALLERSTVHDYLDAPVNEGAIERALQAAIAAPNHRLTEPWRFCLVGKDSRAELIAISADLKAGSKGALDASTLESVRRKMQNPALLIVVTQVKSSSAEARQEDYAAVACAIQNLMLSLHAEGIGSKWSTGRVTTDPRTYRHLGIAPEQEEIVAFVWVGMAAKTMKVARKRDLATLVRRLP